MQPLTRSEREKKNRVSRTKRKAISENLGGNSHSKSQTSKNNYRRFWVDRKNIIKENPSSDIKPS
jgi:hypothetical protein